MRTILTVVVVILALLSTKQAVPQVADSIFPRVAWGDPYWAGYWDTGSWSSRWVDSSYYYPQLWRLGITHVVSEGDAISLDTAYNAARIPIWNDNTGSVKQYSNSTEAHYQVGDPLADAFRNPPSTGGVYNDAH